MHSLAMCNAFFTNPFLIFWAPILIQCYENMSRYDTACLCWYPFNKLKAESKWQSSLKNYINFCLGFAPMHQIRANKSRKLNSFQSKNEWNSEFQQIFSSLGSANQALLMICFIRWLEVYPWEEVKLV